MGYNVILDSKTIIAATVALVVIVLFMMVSPLFKENLLILIGKG